MTLDGFPGLSPMLGGISPITMAERQARMAKAQRLMLDQGLVAIFLEAGSTLQYFTGIRWGRSERMMAAVLPAQGEISYVCPAFEEDRLREMIQFGSTVRAWDEHESPFTQVAGILTDLGIAEGRIGVEATTRFFLVDGIRQAAPKIDIGSADGVTIPCRGIKTNTEIALMQRAMTITSEAFKACIDRLHVGMSQAEFSELSIAAHKAMGVAGHIDVQFGPSTAFPHGSRKMTFLNDGDVVLMDGGCTVEGYWSDISRTIIFGAPTKRQREIWLLEQRAQAAAFAAAQVGVPMEAVDAAARQVIVDAGFGPGYKVPGLPHRTGHGIGLDIHEHYNVVKGNMTPLAPGMCFSNEPMIAIYGEFGIRLEDCVYMTEDGPRYFTQPSPAIDRPFVN
ncbi:Xaa-Pro peptidase family protein [Candidatus Bipolaricaulota bacterium]|nr:Xaa-Pro peptidase family protein [Candidatus Bipolaricaulota bacterium]